MLILGFKGLRDLWMTNFEFGCSTFVDALSLSLVVFPFSLVHITIDVVVCPLTIALIIFPPACCDEIKQER